MKLDTGENIELDIKPNEKILVIWFITKTITYSIATMFFVFMALFFINTINLASEVELEEKNKTEINESITKKENSNDKDEKK